MKFQYNNKEYNYPNALEEITLQARIDFHDRHGAKHNERLKEIADIIDPDEKNLELAEENILFAIKSFSFFTGIPEDEVKENFELSQVMNVYNTSLVMLLEEEASIEEVNEFEIQGQKFVIASPQVTPQSKFTFNEFLVSKEIVRQLDQLGKGRWQSLTYLCCVYLRKPGEAFNEDFVEPGNERYKLMQSIPLNVALRVGFFLTCSMNTYLKALRFSKDQQEKART